MKLKEVINTFSNSNFLLTINGVCDEWLCGIDELPNEEYYQKYKDKKILSMAILSTNETPELIIRIEE